VTIPGRGAVIYLRQEGRGIGLLSKIRAYNLQDLGYDTVAANLMLGHGADERAYDIAGVILRDLGLGGSENGGEDVRLLTNNPDKVEALEKEGVRVVERVAMIPRAWQTRSQYLHLHRDPVKSLSSPSLGAGEVLDGGAPLMARSGSNSGIPTPGVGAGATMIGGGAVQGEDLDKYLRTKVLRMGHMLPLWMQEDPEAA
jgi:GTP cyclohydrolase II